MIPDRTQVYYLANWPPPRRQMGSIWLSHPLVLVWITRTRERKITQQVLLRYINPFSGNLKTKGQKITYSLSRNLLMSQDQPLFSAFYFSILDSHRTSHVQQQLSKPSVYVVGYSSGPTKQKDTLNTFIWAISCILVKFCMLGLRAFWSTQINCQSK